MLSRTPEGLLRRQRALICCSIVADSTLVLYAWHSAASLATLLLLHGLMSVLVTAGGALVLRRDELSGSVLIYILSVACLGPIGIAGCCLMEVVRWASSRSKISREEWYEHLFPRTLTDRTQALYELIEWRGAKPSRESTVAPFCEVLEHGTIEQKQSVVTMIGDHFKSEFAPALQCALNDPEPAIRVQAATAAARIENTFLQQSVALQEEYAKEPNSRSIAQRLALHHEGYARTGLLDPERAASEKRMALEIHMRQLQVAPNDTELTAVVAQLLLELGDPERAISLLGPWLRAKRIPHVIVGPLAETLFALRRLRLLRRVSTRLRASLTTNASDEPLRASFDLWIPAHD